MDSWQRSLAALCAGACLYLTAAPAASASSACPGDDVTPTATRTSDAMRALICDINELRVRRGLTALRWEARLARLAQEHAGDIARSGTISHVGSDGRGLAARVAAVGYLPPDGGGVVLENIGWGDAELGSPSAILRTWLDSDVHRERVLDPQVRELAVGVADGRSARSNGSGVYYVAEFGLRESVPTPAAAGDAPAERARPEPRARRRCARRPARPGTKAKRRATSRLCRRRR